MFKLWRKKGHPTTPTEEQAPAQDEALKQPEATSSEDTVTQAAQETILEDGQEISPEKATPDMTLLSKEVKPEMASPSPAEEIEPPQKMGLFGRLRHGLKRTGTQFSEGIGNLFLGKKTIDANLLEEIETHLLMADVGTQATQRIINDITARVKRHELTDPSVLYEALKHSLCDILKPCSIPLHIPDNVRPYVILMVGVNGAGKTTTIGKLAKRFQQEGKSVLLAAGDTFRAAAIEQLQTWGERNNITVIAQKSGSDSASVIFDGLDAAKARGIDILIADTAGRLHTQSHLMEELRKIKRVLSKLDKDAPHETLLVLDASIGQNAIRQAEQFNDILTLSGLVLSKLDGTAKGGVIFSLAETLKLPIRFVGVGESIDDLQPFNAEAFVEAIFSDGNK
ncbi:MAG: signal recognition particle-docking protein FtsY [Gammaproteobacteria bacterium]|jgi:fused signal recognition particle receptor|nr:signal recognition particle-docking protein FtsY [Gammaproteobacteria bacterium]